MSTKLQHALHLAEIGFYVFRLKKNGKKPLAEGWQEEATRAADEITALFENKDYNIGIFTGKFDWIDGDDVDTQALVVVDVDTKEGKQGAITMQGLDALGNDFPPTLTQQTASGGFHHIYRHPYPLQGGVNKLGLNVDIKSHGGYIVGAGSTVDGTPYEFIFSGNPIANNDPFGVEETPDWIQTRIGRPIEKSTLAPATTVTDSDQAVSRAIAYLKDVAEPAISGNGGNSQTFNTALECRDLGLSEPMTLELLWKHYNKKCQPGWHFDELEKITKNAYAYASKPAGNSSPHSLFTPQPADPKEEAKQQRRKLYYKRRKEITDAVDYPALIEDMLDQGAMSVLYGESNTGKTFIALDLAHHIASNTTWNGKRVTPGGVIYIAAEGGRSAENRVLAFKSRFPDDEIPFALVPCSVNLFDSTEQLKELLTLIRAAEAEMQPIRLIVIDTLSRVLNGGNENSSEDMTSFIANIDVIRAHTKAHTLIVHHSGKDTSKGARGHSSLRAATDTELEIVDNTILIKKQRDMEFAKPQGFELEPVTIGTNAYGKDITSCIVNYVDISARQDFNSNNRLEHRDLIALMALQQCKSGRQLRDYENVVEQKIWAQCCKDFDFTLIPGAVAFPKSEGSFNTAFKRIRDRLSAFGKVVEVESKQWAVEKDDRV